MFCKMCGKELDDQAVFCGACGTQVAVEPVAAPTQVVQNVYPEPERKPVSIAGWIFRPFLALIPIAGPLVYFIMLFVWAGDKTKEKSFNNWAKAQLIALLIAACIAVTAAVIVFIAFGSSYPRYYHYPY